MCVPFSCYKMIIFTKSLMPFDLILSFLIFQGFQLPFLDISSDVVFPVRSFGFLSILNVFPVYLHPLSLFS